jgi:hypothetical protein
MPQIIQAVQHGLSLEASDEQITEAGASAIAAAAAVRNLVVTGPIEKVVDEPCVFLVDGDREGWLPVSDPTVGLTHGPAEARTVVWRAEGDVSPEAVAIEAVREHDGAVAVHVPALLEQRGGSVRAMHRLGVPVTVSAYRHNGDPIGYLAAVEISTDEVEVQVVEGTALLRVSPTPQAPQA